MQGEIVDGVRDAPRKADAEDLRFEDRVERMPPPIESERLPPRDVPIADTAIVPGGDGGDAFDTTDFHHEVNDEIDKDRADRFAIDPGMDIDVVEKDEDVDFDELVKHWDLNTKRQVDEVDNKIMQIVRTLGGNAIQYRRERGRALRAVLSEIFSPPRVTAMAEMCPSYGILPGFALDPTTTDSDGRSWDFDDTTMRERAWAKMKAEESLLIIGSPTCTAFSEWEIIKNPKREPTIVANEC